MFMARQPAQPSLNLPQAIVEFVELIRDPSWLPKYVATAEAVADANKLTVEEAQQLKDAQAIIEEASGLEAKQLAENNRLTSMASQLGVKADDIARREKQCDERNTSLGEFEKSLNALAEELAGKINDLGHKDKFQLELATTLVEEEARLKVWADELAQDQKNWDAARNLVTKKKAG